MRDRVVVHTINGDWEIDDKDTIIDLFLAFHAEDNYQLGFTVIPGCLAHDDIADRPHKISKDGHLIAYVNNRVYIGSIAEANSWKELDDLLEEVYNLRPILSEDGVIYYM